MSKRNIFNWFSNQQDDQHDDSKPAKSKLKRYEGGDFIIFFNNSRQIELNYININKFNKEFKVTAQELVELFSAALNKCSHGYTVGYASQVWPEDYILTIQPKSSSYNERLNQILDVTIDDMGSAVNSILEWEAQSIPVTRETLYIKERQGFVSSFYNGILTPEMFSNFKQEFKHTFAELYSGLINEKVKESKLPTPEMKAGLIAELYSHEVFANNDILQRFADVLKIKFKPENQESRQQVITKTVQLVVEGDERFFDALIGFASPEISGILTSLEQQRTELRAID